MIIYIRWEGRTYSESRFKTDIQILAKLFGVDKPVMVYGYDVGELFTNDEVPDFTKVLCIRAGFSDTYHEGTDRIMTRYSVIQNIDNLDPRVWEDWTTKEWEPASVADWKHMQVVENWQKFPDLPHVLWWFFENEQIMQGQ
jgi:hypothetical protein